jgi:hypothetical protein
VVIATIDLDNVCNDVLLAHDHKCSELFQVRQQAVRVHEYWFGRSPALPMLGTRSVLKLNHGLSGNTMRYKKTESHAAASLCSIAIHLLSSKMTLQMFHAVLCCLLQACIWFVAASPERFQQVSVVTARRWFEAANRELRLDRTVY